MGEAVGVLFVHVADANFGHVIIKDQLSVRAQLGNCAACAPLPTPASSSALELPVCEIQNEMPFLELLIYGEQGGPIYGQAQLPLDTFPPDAFFQAEVELTIPKESVEAGRPSSGVVHILCQYCSSRRTLTDDIVANWQEDFDIQVLMLLNDALEQRSQAAPSTCPNLESSASVPLLDDMKKQDNKLSRLINSKALPHRNHMQLSPLQVPGPPPPISPTFSRRSNISRHSNISNTNSRGSRGSSRPSRSKPAQSLDELCRPRTRETRAERRAKRAASVGGMPRSYSQVQLVREIEVTSPATICSAPSRGARRPKLFSTENTPTEWSHAKEKNVMNSSYELHTQDQKELFKAEEEQQKIETEKMLEKEIENAKQSLREWQDHHDELVACIKILQDDHNRAKAAEEEQEALAQKRLQDDVVPRKLLAEKRLEDLEKRLIRLQLVLEARSTPAEPEPIISEEEEEEEEDDVCSVSSLSSWDSDDDENHGMKMLCLLRWKSAAASYQRECMRERVEEVLSGLESSNELAAIQDEERLKLIELQEPQCEVVREQIKKQHELLERNSAKMQTLEADVGNRLTFVDQATSPFESPAVPLIQEVTESSSQTDDSFAIPPEPVVVKASTRTSHRSPSSGLDACWTRDKF